MESPQNDAQDLSRREALTLAAGGLAAGWLVIEGSAEAAAPALPGDGAQDAEPYEPSKHEWVFLVDIAKCIGCGSCVRACERENNVPPNYFRTWIERYMVWSPERVAIDSPNGGHDGFQRPAEGEEASKGFFVPKLCNHCKFSPCTQLCPVGASYRSPDGIMLVDEERCIGCGYCVQACPYGSRFIHPEKHVASKCTFCYHRITKGLRTACVEACPTGARRFGDKLLPGDEVTKTISTHQVHVLKPELLTGPHCYYQGMSMEVR
jgi:Fe-S-cluster-containing dehydrogenase component